MTERKSGLAHCCHHDTHWEFCYDYDERVESIRANKPAGERALRLRLFALVPKDSLPCQDSPEWADYDKAWAAKDKAWAAKDKAEAAYDKAGAAKDKAWAASVKAWAAYDKAWAAYNKAEAAYDKAWAAYLSKYQTELDAMHDKLFPDCPWDGRTIFGKEVLK